VKCPVLVVVGDRDTVVPSQQSATVIKETLAKAGNPDVSVKIFSGADHFMKPTRSGGPKEMNGDAQLETFVPGYQSTLTEWLVDRLVAPTAIGERVR
jgi:dienelactone hydrolase